MLIKDRPEYSSKPKPATLREDAMVREAIDIMVAGRFGSIVVVHEDETIAGILTERDLMMRLLHNKMDADTTKVSEIMTSEVRVAKENDNLLDWLRIMSNDRFRHLPVVDDEGKIVNMMSQGDFVSYTWPELFSRMKETVKASVGMRYQVAFIIIAMMIYALMVIILV